MAVSVLGVAEKRRGQFRATMSRLNRPLLFVNPCTGGNGSGFGVPKQQWTYEV